MPRTHGYRGVERDEVSVNPLFARQGEMRVPRFRLGADEMLPETAYQIIHDETMLDGNARQNLATFVTTWMEPEAQRLYAEAADKNLVDKDEYPLTAADRGTLHPHPRRLVERARSAPHDGCVHGRVVGGVHARRPRPEASLATARASGRPAHRPPQHRLQLRGPGGLGEVRQLLGGRTEVCPGLARPALPVPRRAYSTRSTSAPSASSRSLG